MPPKILLGLTGSVATSIADKIIPALQDVGEVKVVMTESAIHFANPLTLRKRHAVDVFTDVHEWNFHPGNSVTESTPGDETIRLAMTSADGWCRPGGDRWQKGDPILHIELRRWADILVIAPLTANTLSDMATGRCDKLLTAVFRAWDDRKPVVVAPAMNTFMWEKDITYEQLESIARTLDVPTDPGEFCSPITQNFFIVGPVCKLLACGDDGMGAMAHTDVIAATTREALAWTFPLPTNSCPGIPVGRHPGAFSFARHKCHHTGVDLYCSEGTPARIVEGGTVVGIQGFTGQKVDMPWWYDTDAVLVEGRSGVINYGEIRPFGWLEVGAELRRGEPIGVVVPVVKEGKERPDVPGHSRAMLHVELYPDGQTEWVAWPLGQDEHAHLDPTQLLLDSVGAPGQLPEFEGEP